MWIEDPLEKRVLESPGCGNLPLVGRELVKSSPSTLNEIAAYQLGSSLGLPLPRARYFFTEKPLQIDGCAWPVGTPVLLTEDISPTTHCHSVISAPCCSHDKAKYLAFFTLNRDVEWPEIHISESGIYLLDLEFQFAIFPSSEIDTDAVLFEYAKQSESAIRYSLEMANNCGLIPEYWEFMKEMVASCRDFSPDFGRSSMDKISLFVKKSIELRLDVIAQLL